MTVNIDSDARIEKIRLQNASGTFAGNPATGYSWLYSNITGSYYGLRMESNSGEILRIPFYEGAKVYSTGTAIPNVSFRAIGFNLEVFDTDGIHDTATGTNARLTCQTPGKYLIAGHAGFSADSTGDVRLLCIRKNQSTDTPNGRIAQSNGIVNAGIGSFVSVTTVAYLSTGDWVELVAYHDKGSDLNIEYYPDFSPYFMMQRIG